jgi:hypothetical protein
MKKIGLILSLFAIIFSSCETDFDVHAPWEEITVVYGLLDQSQDRQYIKINKAYLGVGDALQMSQIADSINFLDSMVVKLHKVPGDTAIILYKDSTIEKDPGLFAYGIGENIIYSTLEKDSDFVEVGKTYTLTIENTESGNFVSGNTGLISGFLNFNINSDYIIKFYNPTLADSAKFLKKMISWNKANNGQIYQVDIRINYTENDIETFLVWKQPLVSSAPSMSTPLEGAKFFNFLRNNLTDDNSVIREFVSLDVKMTIGTADLETYIAMNAPYEGLVQERPVYTNINNGFGLFSARYTYELLGLELSDDTQDYLKDELNRNFQ